MNKLVGTLLATAAFLTACGTTSEQGRIPQAKLAPTSTISGTIPSEAHQYGVITFGSTMASESVTFSEPFYSFAFDSTGAFNVPLPKEVTGGFSNYPGCSFDGHAAIGLLYALAAPATGDSAPLADIRATYRPEDAGVLAFFWYSPVAIRLQCTSSMAGNMSGGLLEDWDLQLAAGWNQVVAYQSPDSVHLRTGPSSAAWIKVEY